MERKLRLPVLTLECTVISLSTTQYIPTQLCLQTTKAEILLQNIDPNRRRFVTPVSSS